MDDPPSNDLSSTSGLPLDFDGSAPLKPGQVLFERYIVERQIGEGGMGTVWLVKHREFDSERALKLIVSGIARDQQARARFRREARILDRLNHPNAVRVYDARLGKDIAFIEMEYVRGMSLNQMIVPGVPMDLDWVLDLLEQLCDVLQAANDEGIIHRDLKPPNLMLVAGRQPGTKVLKLLDFGIAKIRGGGDDVRTLTGSFMGTPLYSSPEQITGERVDARSDIYSVGLILYELLTGRRPFEGSMNAIIYKHTMVPPSPFAEINPEAKVPAAVEAVVLQCLAKDADLRPQSPRELLERFRQAVAIGGPPGTVVPRPAKPDSYLAQTLEGPELGRPAPARGRRLSVVLAIGLLLALLLVPLIYSQNQKWPRPLTPTPDPAKGRAPDLAARDGKSRISPIELARRIPEQIKLWERQGYAVDPRGGKTAEGWPRTLVRIEDKVNFTYDASGLYLPPKYKLEQVSDSDRSLRTLIRDDGSGVTFAWLPGGEFRMGSIRNVTVPGDTVGVDVKLAGFFMQTTEVTNGEIEPFIASLGSDACADWTSQYKALNKKYVKKAAQHPASSISWRIADQYAREKSGRLPSEAQWEYAARSGGLNLLYVWDDPEKVAADRPPQPANINFTPGTSAVKGYEFDRTAQGVYDMAGNVSEWCRDVWKELVPAAEPIVEFKFRSPPESWTESDTTKMVVRGGSFYSALDEAQTIFRPQPRLGQVVTGELGFRIVIECPEIPPDLR